MNNRFFNFTFFIPIKVPKYWFQFCLAMIDDLRNYGFSKKPHWC